MATILDRFMAKVEPEPNTGCWLWSAAIKWGGYGHMNTSLTPGMSRAAHRLAYQLHVGPIPTRMLVLHKCDVPVCVNPDHLFLGDDIANARDMMRKRRHPNARRTHCTAGHELAGKNLLIKVIRGYRCRYCRTCVNAGMLARYYKKRRSIAA